MIEFKSAPKSSIGVDTVIKTMSYKSKNSLGSLFYIADKCTSHTMTIKQKWANAQWPLLVLLGIALGIRMWLAWHPITELVSLSLPDDAFYYFVIARNVVSGLGSSFDGTTLTNGYHPLWLLLILPIFALHKLLLVSSLDFPIHIALSLSALFDTATVYACFVLVRKTTSDSKLAFFSSALYAFNPYVISQSVNGVETAVNNLLLSASIWVFIHQENGNEPRTIKQLVVTGSILGGTFLSRTDNIFFIVFLLLGYALLRWSRRGLFNIAVIGVTQLVVVSPWLAWNWIMFGNLVQTSGLAIPFREHISHQAAPLADKMVIALIKTVHALRFVGLSSGLGLVPMIALYAGLLIFILSLFLINRKSSSKPSKESSSKVWPVWALMGSVVLVLLIHASVRWVTREWYFASVGLVTALTLGGLLPAMLQERTRIIVSNIVFFVSIFLFVLEGSAFYRTGLYPWQPEMITTAQWLYNHTNDSTLIGAFNAGIYGYYSGRPVINLDGVLDSGALQAVRERDLASYISERSLQIIVDYELFFSDKRYGSFLGSKFKTITHPLATLPSSWPNLGNVIILKVDLPP